MRKHQKELQAEKEKAAIAAAQSARDQRIRMGEW